MIVVWLWMGSSWLISARAAFDLTRRASGDAARRRVAVVSAWLCAAGGALTLLMGLTAQPTEKFQGLMAVAMLAHAASVGAFAGAWLAPLLGRPGLRGWALALPGAYGATLVAGVVGGTTFAPGIGTAGGLGISVGAPLTWPTAPAWVGWALILHRVLRRMRHPSSPGRA